MKPPAILAERYAEAFLARETGTERGGSIREMMALKEVLRLNPDFEKFLLSLQFTLTEKHTMIERVLGESFSSDVKNFIRLLLEKERIDCLNDILEYVRITHSYGDRVEAVLKTTYPLDLDVIEGLKQKLETKVGKKINLYIDLDPDLLGGIYVRVGNRVFDGSVRKRLEDLRAKLKTVQVK
jgi:F-type H+-transporting ATPase subunit delta